MNFLIAIAFVVILGALASAGFFMLRKPPADQQTGASQRRMARALAVRVGVSVALFLIILLSYRMGWIHPTGIPMR